METEPLEDNLITLDPAYLSSKPQATSPTETADAKELSKDHQLFARYPGALLRNHETVDYETMTLPAAPGSPDQTPMSLSGDLARHFYVVKDTSTLKICENYKQALDSAGFSVLSHCELDTCSKDREAQQLGNKISVEDNVYNYYRKPYRENNLTLSQQRAAAVVDSLVKQHGIAAARLLAQGVGPFAPAASNDNETGRQKNHRVELVKRLQ